MKIEIWKIHILNCDCTIEPCEYAADFRQMFCLNSTSIVFLVQAFQALVTEALDHA